MKNERNCLNFLNQCSYPVKVENKTKCSNASREDNFKENTLFFFLYKINSENMQNAQKL